MSALRFKIPVLGLLAMVVTGAMIFHFLQRQLPAVWLEVGVHPEVLAALERSLDDQRRLATHEPEAEKRYRERFAAVETLLHRLRILEHNRASIVRRYQQILLLAFAATVALVTGASVLGQSRQAARLRRLQGALGDLAQGRTDIQVGERRRDLIGRIAAMIERTSRVMARDRQRLAALTNLSGWQEAARRHAHEMRTPLTGARLELSRLSGLLERKDLEDGDDLRQAARGARQELERLGRFAQELTSFARLPRPQPRPYDLRSLVAEFAATFESAWPNLELIIASRGELPAAGRVEVDRDLLRQVLVNLCDNSSLALGEDRGRVRLTLSATAERVILDAADDGPGIAEEVRPRLFEPYSTSRDVGEGMGLGLAISKKILLDHGGDLELLQTSPAGTTFRLTFPRSPACGSPVAARSEADAAQQAASSSAPPSRFTAPTEVEA